MGRTEKTREQLTYNAMRRPRCGSAGTASNEIRMHQRDWGSPRQMSLPLGGGAGFLDVRGQNPAPAGERCFKTCEAEENLQDDLVAYSSFL